MESLPSARKFKDELYQQYARIGKCLSSDKRLEILSLLAQGPKSVEKLAQQSEMSVANVSRHLQILLDARLVKFNKQGTYVIYTLGAPEVSNFLLSLWRLCESQLADISRMKEDFLQHFDDVLTLSLDEVMDKLEAGTIILLDVRPTGDFVAGHMPGAISIPIDEIDEYIQNLPRDIEVAAYCRGPFCIYSTEVVKKLQNEGFTVYRLEEGYRNGMWSIEGPR
ncbi:metalloregulator ArsR/SmtB family transcription factor [Paenibacillus sp. MZ04-78.2]|uniref:ArsR/SmtB family transcription factor n=1 Tax=Paenibacillus sp. MZ04-78.2 TaxID=2962034 RepID=UPI0020B7BA7F|nr:metalloregulator ArsR/SmtB family transcription factor [Paenibacillus sp. MZ04-78.2]MCP3775074.1 metalloregulator ArsR/SmtB family transcription factor [Paenibacillus sp. MZ04-78.2]